MKGAPAPAICARRCRCKFPPKPNGVACESGRCKVLYKKQAAVPSNIEAARVPGKGAFKVSGVITKLPKGAVQPQPPKLPWSKDRVCTTDGDCVLVPRPPCTYTPCKRQWRKAVNREALKALKANWARHRRCKPQPAPTCAGYYLGNRAVCVEEQCAVASGTVVDGKATGGGQPHGDKSKDKCYQSCLQSNMARAESWESIQAGCRSHCGIKGGP